jgi:hypothetical protein
MDFYSLKTKSSFTADYDSSYFKFRHRVQKVR